MQCLICKQDANFIAHAILAPWISLLIGGGVIRSRLFKCEGCDFQFFEYRYSKSEVDRIYSSYRRGVYESSRRNWEPWYTSGINNLYRSYETKGEISKRKKRMMNQFDNAGIDMNFKNCLDFGGDDGQFFPDSITGNRYLIDPSSSPSQKFVDKIQTVQDIESIPEKLELVMCCMVMEHLSSFSQIMSAVSDKLEVSRAGQKGLFYIEIPMDGFKVGKWARSRIYYRYLTFILKIQPLFISLDFLTGVFRNYFRTIPIFGVVKQSEHINYFSKQSITKLLSKDFEVVFVSDENRNEKYGHFRLGFLAAIAKNRHG